uniref:Myb-like domain-containing protein n=1 Tax=Physcomitrium patens TaxID=3218 RepID=A0A7I4CND0_PHYPA|nr:uncharacterized protein LOC112276311 isoform X1 [Physcomitrium patens]|eukprot:XP_024363260.1 uncharacterized protein LOC112276311 isoform X1 [Physcomitrella patens]
MPSWRRVPGRPWVDDEIYAMLESMLEPMREFVLESKGVAARASVGFNTWDYISDNLFDEYCFDRASMSCQQQWDTLLQSYRAIQDHESKIQSDTRSCVSYWKIYAEERSNKKLPLAFDLEWYKLIEKICAAKIVEENCMKKYRFMCSEFDEINTMSEYEFLSGVSTTTMESQTEVAAGSYDSAAHGRNDKVGFRISTFTSILKCGPGLGRKEGWKALNLILGPRSCFYLQFSSLLFWVEEWL